MAPARWFFPAILVALLLLPAFPSHWFIREGPDTSNVDYVPKGGEISIVQSSGLFSSSEKIVFSGNERFYLKSGTATFLSGVNNSLEIEFASENFEVAIALFSEESGEIVEENRIIVSGSLAEAVFEGPIVSLADLSGGRSKLSVSGIVFQEDGPGAVLLKAREGEVYSVKGLAGFSPEKRTTAFAIYLSLGIFVLLGGALIALSISRGKKGQGEILLEKERKEGLYEIQRSVFGKR